MVLPPLDGGMANLLETCSCPTRFTIPYVMALDQTVKAYVWSAKNFGGCWGSPPWDMDMVDPLEISFSPPVFQCQIQSFGVKPYKHNYGDLSEVLTTHALPFNVTQGHWN